MTEVRILRSLEEKVASEHTALLIIDMQNDFCAEGGYLHGLGVDVAPTAAIVPRIRALIDRAHESNVLVVHVWYDGDPAFLLPPMMERLERKHSGEPYCVPGTWGAEFVSELQPDPGDLVVAKHLYSAFFGTSLEMILRSRGIETVVLTGTATNNCVDGTGRDAYSLGFYVVLVSDAAVAPTTELHEATLQTANHAYGVTTTADELIPVWAAAPNRPPVAV